jgi:hypothetical protein
LDVFDARQIALSMKELTTVGLDIGKRVLHAHGADRSGAAYLSSHTSSRRLPLKMLLTMMEAAIGGDLIAAENFYQHAEHYFCVSNASRDGNPHAALQPTTPADAAISGLEQGSSETDRERSQPGREDDRPGFI